MRNMTDSSVRREVFRWGACFALILMVHVGAAYALLQQPDIGEISDSSPVIEVDFATTPMADAPARAVMAGAEQTQTEAAPPPAEAKPEPTTENEKTPEPQKTIETPPRQQANQAQPAPEEPAATPPLLAQESEVTLSTTPPPPPKASEKKEESKEKSEAQLTPPLATASETTAPTSAATRHAALMQWEVLLAKHLRRFLKYPPGADRALGATVTVAFTVDRNGQVLAVQVNAPSRYALLNEEAVAVVRRAQPFPRAPRDVSGPQFSFNVPVQFNKE